MEKFCYRIRSEYGFKLQQPGFYEITSPSCKVPSRARYEQRICKRDYEVRIKWPKRNHDHVEGKQESLSSEEETEEKALINFPEVYCDT